jgi:hypothetical protein
MIAAAQLEAPAAWAYSSVVEHCVDIAGVASSILATPTIFTKIPKMSDSSAHALLGATPCHLLWARVKALKSL